MPYTIEHFENPGFVLTVFSDEITVDLLNKNRAEIRKCLQEANCDRLLVDAQEFHLRQDLAEEFEFAGKLVLARPVNTHERSYEPIASSSS